MLPAESLQVLEPEELLWIAPGDFLTEEPHHRDIKLERGSLAAEALT